MRTLAIVFRRLLIASVFGLAIGVCPRLSQAAPFSEVPQCTGLDGRFALLIGNQDYKGALSALSNPRRDTEAFAKLLCANGFTVYRHSDLGVKDFDQALKRFSVAARGGKTSIVYYSGHGFAAGGRNWLVPVDAGINCDSLTSPDTDDLQRSLVSLSTGVLDRLKGTGDQIIVLDACRTDPIRSCFKGGISPTLEKGLGRSDSKDGRLIVYATQDGQPALDGVEGSDVSPLMTAILNRLPANSKASWLDAMADAGSEVEKLTHGVQQPNFDFSRRPQGCLSLSCDTPTKTEHSLLDVINTSTDRAMIENLSKKSLVPETRAAAEKRLVFLHDNFGGSPEEATPVSPHSATASQFASLEPGPAYNPEAQALNPGFVSRPSPSAQDPATCPPPEIKSSRVDDLGDGQFLIEDACSRLKPLTVGYNGYLFTFPGDAGRNTVVSFDFFAGPQPLTIRTNDGRAVQVSPPRFWDQSGLAKAIVMWDGPDLINLHAFERSPDGLKEITKVHPRPAADVVANGGGFISQAGSGAIPGKHLEVYTFRQSPDTNAVVFTIDRPDCSTAKTAMHVIMLRYQNGEVLKGPERMLIRAGTCDAVVARALELKIPF